MKILVAVKRVVDAKIKVRPLPDHSGVDVKLAKMAINPFDEIAVEKAVSLREAGKADEVVAVTIGPLKSVDTLRVAMAIGADRSVHVRTDDVLEPLAVAKVLREIVKREQPDLVLLGKQAIDDDANQTGQMLSALCDMPLATFAMETYAEDSCSLFGPKVEGQECTYNEKTLRMIAQMHKAISIIQFKLEAEIISRRPEFGMENRRLLHLVDFERGVFVYEGKEYPLRDVNFPTIDPADPYRLSDEERELMHRIHSSFMNSEKMKKHMRCLFTYGGMYLVCNSNLLYHASVPLNADGSFKHVRIGQKEYWGRKLLKKTDQLIRTAYFDEDGSDEKQFALDYVWYMWCGPDAPSFDKDKMATFERYFVADKTLHKETKGHYYALRNEAEVCDRILEEFGVKPGPHSHIINGHVPVKTIKGEKPIKADGKLLVIDGGFSKAYQPETGIAGYTLVYHSHGLQLVQHEPFQSRQKAIEEGQDIKSTTLVVEFNSQRMMVKDTDKGSELVTQIQDLMKLLVAYRTGLIKEKQ